MSEASVPVTVLSYYDVLKSLDCDKDAEMLLYRKLDAELQEKFNEAVTMWSDGLISSFDLFNKLLHEVTREVKS